MRMIFHTMLQGKRRRWILICAIACGLILLAFLLRRSGLSEEDREMIARVKVERCAIDFDQKEDSKGQFLIALADSPFHEGFSELTNIGWRDKWEAFSLRILDLARKGGFDYSSLNKCLQRIFDKNDTKIALVPVSAYLAKKGNADVWIIICRWEYADTRQEHLTLDHFRAWAFLAVDQQQVGYVSCK